MEWKMCYHTSILEGDFNTRRPGTKRDTTLIGTIQTILRSRTDYVMTSPTLRHHFRNIQLVDPRIHKSDHYVIKATIKSAHRKAQKKYLQGRRKFPPAPITPNSPTFTQADQLFMELKCPDPSRSSPISGQTGCQIIPSNSFVRDAN